MPDQPFKPCFYMIVTIVTTERLRNDNTTATQCNEQKGDLLLISQLQLNFFTIREILCVVLPFCCHFVISLIATIVQKFHRTIATILTIHGFRMIVAIATVFMVECIKMMDILLSLLLLLIVSLLIVSQLQ